MKAVILAGGQDIGKCPLSMVRPRPLFPLMTGVLLQDLLLSLSHVGVEEAVICANGRTGVIRSHFEFSPGDIELDFHDDKTPRGTAGCVKDVEDFVGDDTFLVVEGGLFLDGSLGSLLDGHRRNKAALTVGAVPAHPWNASGKPPADGELSPLGVYVVEPEVLNHIPKMGYCDIKEQLIPRLQAKFVEVGVSQFDGRFRRIFDAPSYGSLIQEMLTGVFGNKHFSELAEIGPDVWAGKDAATAPSAKIIGPVVIGPKCVIGKNVVIKGPTVIGEGTTVDDKAVIISSILWPHVTVGLGARIENSIIADFFRVSVFEQLSRCVAIDRDLKLGDMHGLEQGGYNIDESGKLRSFWKRWLPL